MPKKDNELENQLNLFDFDPKEKELRLKEINKIKKLEKEAREKIKDKQRKEFDKRQKQEEKKILSTLSKIEKVKRIKAVKEFNKSLKLVREYLSWNHDPKYRYGYINNFNWEIGNKYSQKISTVSGIRTFSFKWHLPLFEEFYKIDEDDFIYSDDEYLSWRVDQYRDFLKYCEELFHPRKDLFEYFPFTITMKEGKKEPKWYSDFCWNVEKTSYKFNDQDISLKRKKNIIIFDWQISDDFKKIELIDEQELFDRIRYSCE